ncbi:MFS transporter [Actinomadura viridis]|uniref:MFS family permease n=1 Tax=Actinomadura viridis TaxID=58110 RepID=A0A931GLU6_9ACTN|nr:MFS transporter [Actinomadura viridis]MBG6092448.1 MFS family permease [Actinomadura viridis]
MPTSPGSLLPSDDPPDHAGRPAAGQAGVLGGPYRAATLGIVLVVTLLAFESMAIGTVMPVIARDLDGLALYAWGFSATLIAGLPANVLAGGWVDRSGPARPLLTGLATFVAGLVVAGAAPDMWTFVAGRAVQGVGTGVALVATYVLIARVYPERLHPRVFAALSAAWVLPSLIGPAVGGVVSEHLGWRWVFLGLIPLVVPPVLMLLPALRGLRRAPSPATGSGTDSADPGSDPGSGSGSGTSRGARRHLAAIVVAIGAAVLLYGLDHPGWGLVPLAAAGLAGLAAGLPRLLPAGTLRMRRGLPSVVLIRGLLSGSFFGMDVFIPLALISLHGFSPTQAGVVLTVASLGWSAASQVQGRARRSGVFYVRLGAALVTLGIALTALALQVTGWAAAPAWIIGGAGMGFAFGSLSVLLLEFSPEEEQGANSSSLQIADMLGSSLVVGGAGALVTAFGTGRLALGLGLAGSLLAAIAAVGLIAALRLDAGTPRRRGGRPWFPVRGVRPREGSA